MNIDAVNCPVCGLDGTDELEISILHDPPDEDNQLYAVWCVDCDKTFTVKVEAKYTATVHDQQKGSE
jgi:hypothetical protein